MIGMETRDIVTPPRCGETGATSFIVLQESDLADIFYMFPENGLKFD
jgi:hypothetical protein